MANWQSIGDLVQRTTHLVPGVPEHPRGHLGRASAAPARPARPVHQGEPQVLVGRQRRIATFAGRK